MMVDLNDLQSIAYIAQIIGVAGTLTAAFIGVRSYLNNNKRAEENKHKELETRNRELQTRQAQMFMNIYDKASTKDFTTAWNIFSTHDWKNYEEYREVLQKKGFMDAFSIIAMRALTWRSTKPMRRSGYT